MIYSIIFSIFFCTVSVGAGKVVGILKPAQHTALDQIARGVQETVQYKDVTFKVQNAQGDQGMQRAIIQKFMNQGVDVIVPIGTQAMQMTASMVHDTPIVGVSVQPSHMTYNDTRPCNVTGTHDEVLVDRAFEMMQVVMPKIKKIALVYSANEKIMPEVDRVLAISKDYDIKVVPKMIQQLSDIYAATQTLSQDVEAIFILKDHMVVSGVETLILEAKKRGILLISSDEGTVEKGAMFAIGSTEYDSGVLGGALVDKILTGEQIAKLPFVHVSDLSVFYNPTTCPENVQESLKSFSKSKDYALKSMGSV